MTFTFRMSCLCATIAISFCAGPVNAQQFPSKPPAPGPVRVANFPPFKESRLSNGLRLVVVERHNAPVVSLSLSVPAGQSRDTNGRNGLAQLVSSVLEKGAGNRSADEIAATLDRMGASIGSSVDMDYLTVFGTSLTTAAPQLFEIFADVVARPTFPEKEIELSRSTLLAGLQNAMNQPATMAALTLASAIYSNHPYGAPLLPETVQGLKRADVVAFHRDNFRPDGALLVVSGDIDQPTATALAERVFAAWTGRARPVALPAPTPRKTFEILLVNRPGSVQSTLLFGNPTALPTDPYRIPSTVMERIVGGGPTARLFNILREKHGWTYGAYANLAWPSGTGYITASADVRTEVTDSAAAVLMQELKRMHSEPVSETELVEARDALNGIFPLKVQTAEHVAAQVRSMKLQGLPDSWLPSYRTRIAAVTAADVQAVARKYIRPDNGVLVVVGDAGKIIEGLRKVGPVRTVDIFGKDVDL